MTTSFKTSITRFTCANCGKIKDEPAVPMALDFPLGWISVNWPAPGEYAPANKPDDAQYYFCGTECVAAFFTRVGRHSIKNDINADLVLQLSHGRLNPQFLDPDGGLGCPFERVVIRVQDIDRTV